VDHPSARNEPDGHHEGRNNGMTYKAIIEFIEAKWKLAVVIFMAFATYEIIRMDIKVSYIEGDVRLIRLIVPLDVRSTKADIQAIRTDVEAIRKDVNFIKMMPH
jgi:hypothetical protein